MRPPTKTWSFDSLTHSDDVQTTKKARGARNFLREGPPFFFAAKASCAHKESVFCQAGDQVVIEEFDSIVKKPRLNN